ncbi:MAG TPA: RsmE family RNA methyltransferase [Candidatus Omnitrophota bacterium]|nr:RsmE family RNA methyltransferase [Candidatus Omnitrophota bacterium]HRZ14845.1 RsmE family RNA methyltransferase [Candidatus Omnitrophota bacterium]
MHRFFCADSDIGEGLIHIRDRQQLHHIKDVLRLKEGKSVTVCDTAGNEYAATIKSVSAQEIVCAIKSKRARSAQDQALIAVACAIPKQSRMDDMIDKLTQLGVDSIMPLITHRVIVKLDAAKKLERQARWQKIAASASKQSQRTIVPVVEEIMSFDEMLAASAGFELKLIPTLDGSRVLLQEALRQGGVCSRSVIVAIGPEGDFTPEEVERALQAGFQPVSFGTQVLRVETAAVYAASVLGYVFRGQGRGV